jgi:hypothetical protein
VYRASDAITRKSSSYIEKSLGQGRRIDNLVQFRLQGEAFLQNDIIFNLVTTLILELAVAATAIFLVEVGVMCIMCTMPRAAMSTTKTNPLIRATSSSRMM